MRVRIEFWHLPPHDVQSALQAVAPQQLGWLAMRRRRDALGSGDVPGEAAERCACRWNGQQW